jgi:hypothetical protein
MPINQLAFLKLFFFLLNDNCAGPASFVDCAFSYRELSLTFFLLEAPKAKCGPRVVVWFLVVSAEIFGKLTQKPGNTIQHGNTIDLGGRSGHATISRKYYRINTNDCNSNSWKLQKTK